MPLAGLMARLKDREFVFVILNHRVAGIITQADLNKPPIRVYLFGLVSLLEMHLSYWIRTSYPGDSWQKSLSSNRLALAEKVRDERRKRKQDLDLIDCLQFGDKRDLVVKLEAVRNDLDMGSKKKSESRLRDAEDLRNPLAHSQYDLVCGATWNELIELVQWMESVINKSDAVVEARARKTAGKVEVPALW